MEILTPKMDFVFRELMEDPEIRRYFISDVLDMPVEQIKETKLGNTFLRRQQFWEKRSLYYLAKMYTDVLFVGEDYHKLQRCVSIHILDFNLTDQEEYHSVYRMRNEIGKDYSDLLELHTIELRKKLNGNASIDDWIKLFNSRTEEDLNMIKTKNMGIQRAKQLLREMSLTDTIRETIEEYRKIKMDRRAEDAYVYDQGKAEGEQIGEQRGVHVGEQRMLYKLVSEGKIDLNTAIDESGMSRKQFEEEMVKAGYQLSDKE